jgi:hypothetical protein
MDEENKQAIVLGIISRGISNFNKISKESKVEPENLELILQRLEKSEWIKVDGKKGWLGTKIEIKPTEEGYRALELQLKELQKKWNQLENTYKSGNKQKLEQELKDDKSALPTMMMFGIVDMMMFSMIGSSMSSFIPTEDVQVMNDEGGDFVDSDLGDDGEFDIDIGF